VTRPNAITLPDDTGAHVAQETQYGMVLPDGSIEWNVLSVQGREYAIKDLVEKRQGQANIHREWPAELKRRAKLANLNPYDYSNQHRIITRTVMVAVTEAQTHSTPRPWAAPDPGQRPAEVKDAEPAVPEENPWSRVKNPPLADPFE